MALEGYPKVQCSHNSSGDVTIDLTGPQGGLSKTAGFSAQPSARHGACVEYVLLAGVVILKSPL